MTPDRDALYQAICAHPNEDTPRLAFADLVEEEGDCARAAFIRTQVELARTPDYDPLWVKCRQFDPAALTGWAMAHTLPAVPPGFSWRHFAFRRGFPWGVAAEADGFDDRLPELLAAAPVQALSFDNRYRPDLAALADCPHLARLRRLEFSTARFDADDLARLGASPHAEHLAELAFTHDGIDAGGLQALAGSPLFPRLEVLELGSNVIPPALLVDALAAAREPGNLRKLSLPFNRIPHEDAPQLFALPVVQGLTHLDLSNNRLDVDGVVALAESRAIRGLRVLNLSKALPGVPGVKAIAEAGGFAGVRSLDLSENRLGPVAVGLLAKAPGARGLRVLNLANNSITDAGAEALAGARNLAGLLELDLTDAEFGDAGAIALAESEHLGGLLRLVLHRSSGRRLGDAARAALLERFGERVCLS
ncbi:MAG TPA: TIGR02996 domain-containing protein [Gemmataceae bacterium]|nr:TIGR02996 domain-containing protein [Gemmataceae bacterium]